MQLIGLCGVVRSDDESLW